MRKSRLMQWIEEAEARQVVTLALSEAPPSPVSLPSPATTWRMRGPEDERLVRRREPAALVEESVRQFDEPVQPIS